MLATHDGAGARRCPAPTRSRAPACAPVDARAERRAGAHQRHAGERGGARARRARRPRAWRAPPTSRRRCRSTRCADRSIRSRRASTRPGRSPARPRRRPISLRLVAGQRHQRVARQLRQGAGRVRAALRAAGARLGARSHRLRAPARRDRSQRRHRQSRWSSPTRGDIVSGGNFHGAPVALAADTLAIGLAQLATISERRTDRLMNAHRERPAAVSRSATRGLNSGLMMAHVTAAALTSEIKTLCASGRGRHDSDVGGPRRSRQHEHGRGAQGGAHRRTRATTSSRSNCWPPRRPSTCWRRCDSRRARCACTRASARVRADARRAIVRRRRTSIAYRRRSIGRRVARVARARSSLRWLSSSTRVHSS